MLEDRPRINFLRILTGLLLVALLIGGGYMLYRVGYTHGAVNSGMGDMDFFQYSRSPHGSYYSPFTHFFPGGFLIGLLFLLLITGLFRRAFFRPRWGMHLMGGWEARAEKWHAEEHARMKSQTAPPTDDSSGSSEA